VKITIVIGPSFPVPPVRGGAMAKAWEALAREFVQLGHEVTIVSRRFEGQPDREARGNLRFMRTWGFSQSTSTAYDLVRDFAYALNVVPRLPPADILITNDFWVPAIAPLLKRSAGRVVVSAARFPKGQYGLYRRAFRIVALSRAVGNAIAAQEPRLAARTVVIPLPVDVEALAPLPQAQRRPDRTLLFVGRVHPEKGVVLLVKAFVRIAKEFPDWRLRIVGPAAESDGGGGLQFLESLRALAQAAPVEFCGPEFDSRRLADVYRGADLLCYPSLAEKGEAFGVVPLESMAAGVAPLVSALECFQDFVQEGISGWVFDHRAADPEASLATALSSIMRDGDARLVLAKNALLESRKHGFRAVARRYIREFEEDSRP